MILCATESRRGSILRLCCSVTTAIANATPMRRTVSASNLWPSRYCLIGMGDGSLAAAQEGSVTRCPLTRARSPCSPSFSTRKIGQSRGVKPRLGAPRGQAERARHSRGLCSGRREHPEPVKQKSPAEAGPYLRSQDVGSRALAFELGLCTFDKTIPKIVSRPSVGPRHPFEVSLLSGVYRALGIASDACGNTH